MTAPKSCGHDDTNPDCDWLCCSPYQRINRREVERETEERRREIGDDTARDEALSRFYGVEVA